MTMTNKERNGFNYLEKFNEYTDFFLSIESNKIELDYIDCNIVFVKIFNSILCEVDQKIKDKKVGYIVFWINFIIEKANRQIQEPLLTTILTIIDKLDLQQLIKFTNKDFLPLDFRSELNMEIRQIFNDDIILTDAQIDMLMAILAKKILSFLHPHRMAKLKLC